MTLSHKDSSLYISIQKNKQSLIKMSPLKIWLMESNYWVLRRRGLSWVNNACLLSLSLSQMLLSQLSFSEKATGFSSEVE